MPRAQPSPRGGRPRADDRACLEGILWVLITGSHWRGLPDPLPSAVTCWRRLREWEAAGVWLPIWLTYLYYSSDEELCAWARAFADAVPLGPSAAPTARRGNNGRSAFWWRMASAFFAQPPA